MSISHLLEDFETNLHAGSKRMVFSDIQLEEFRLAAFESGYAAGWEDAIANQGEAQAKAVEALGKRIEDLSYTYNEALSEMLLTVEPVFRALIDQILPDHIDAVMASALVDRLKAISKDAVGNEMIFEIPPGAAQYLNQAQTDHNGVSVRLVEDPALAPERASIKLARQEEEIDLTAFSAAFRQAIDSTFFEIKQEIANG